jgi:DNA-binding MarR family transcriptional regulator
MERIALAVEDDSGSALPRRYEALAFIIEQIVRWQTSPTYREIADRLKISRGRAEQLVAQLIAEGRIERVPGSGRRLRVVDIDASRVLLDDVLRRLQWSVAEPMGEMLAPLAQVQLPMMPEIEQLYGIE